MPIIKSEVRRLPRPMRKRRVYQQPGSYHFVGNEPSRGDVVLTLDEFEAVRLCDYVGLEQGEAAKRLDVARSTFQNILNRARKKLAEVLIYGKDLRIEEGSVVFARDPEWGCCQFILRSVPRVGGLPDFSEEEQTMKIAVTYDAKNGEIFQHFGKTENFKVYDVEDGKVKEAHVEGTNGQGHGALAGVLKNLGVEALICGGIGGGAQQALNAQGIRFYGGCSGQADQAVADFLAGKLAYQEDVQCSHHDHNHGEGGCGSHGCHH